MTVLKYRDRSDEICLSTDLSTWDPYDIWKTKLGLQIKSLFNSNALLGIIPASVLTLFDLFINNSARFFYKRQEYPIVRALAAQVLLKEYLKTQEYYLLISAREHLEWLVRNSSKGYSGYCWGLGFEWPAGKNVIYNKDTPHSTHTPYALEAFCKYSKITGDNRYVDIIKSIYNFFEEDIKIMYDDEISLATSYGPFRDRIITNAVSYTLYSYALFLDYLPEHENFIKRKIEKLYNFIKGKQQSDGSWLYAPNDKNSFIDCFHSCFIVKNLFKTSEIIELEGVGEVIESGYRYIKTEFYDRRSGLFKRFTLKNKPSLIRYDLYDNAEVLNLAILMKDDGLAESLHNAIERYFTKDGATYSAVDILGIKRNKNSLRWALLPYIYALSHIK